MAARNATRLANGRSAVPQHARVRILPTNRERLVDLNVLAGFDAAAAEDALIGIVPIKGIGRIDRVRFVFEGSVLMLDSKELGGVMDRAVPVVIIADGAVKLVIAENL